MATIKQQMAQNKPHMATDDPQCYYDCFNRCKVDPNMPTIKCDSYCNDACNSFNSSTSMPFGPRPSSRAFLKSCLITTDSHAPAVRLFQAQAPSRFCGCRK